MALKFIDNNKANPFFLYIPVTMPHDNGEAPEGEKYESPTLEPYEDEDWSFEKKSRAAIITRMDKYIGLIMEELEKKDLSHNTILIFTSDNGCDNPDFFNGSGVLRGMKRDVYEGGIRVPLIVRWPGKIKAGSVSDHVSAFWDFLPTACEIAGIDIGIETDGISYLPELLGKPQSEHEYLYWEFQELGKKQAARKGKWKAVRLNVYETPDAPLELFDLETDIGEQNDVAGQFPEVVKQMEEIIEKAHESDPNWPMFADEF